MTISLIKYRVGFVVVDILSKTFRRIGIIQERVIEQFQSHIFQSLNLLALSSKRNTRGQKEDKK